MKYYKFTYKAWPNPYWQTMIQIWKHDGKNWQRLWDNKGHYTYGPMISPSQPDEVSHDVDRFEITEKEAFIEVL